MFNNSHNLRKLWLLSKFVIDKGYQAIAGSDRFDIDVIKHLLLFPNPSCVLSDYQKAVVYCFISPSFIPDFAKSIFFKLGFDQSQKWFFIAFTLVISVYITISSLYKLAPYYCVRRLFSQENQWLDFEW